MAAGTRIASSGNAIQYAGASISSGVTKGLLNVFRDTSGIAPSSGDNMFPNKSTSDYKYIVSAGTYGGSYFINRNDPVGESQWSTINSTGKFYMNGFYDYIHWPTDNRFVTTMDNMTPDDIRWYIDCDGNKVLDDTIPATTMYDPSSGAPYYMASGAGSSGAFSAAGVNTNWTVNFTISNLTQIQPTSLTIDVRDYDTNNPMYSNNVTLDPGNGWTFSDFFRNEYYRIAYWIVTCN
jgi:hypothetical protein